MPRQDYARHDPQRPRKAQRAGRQKGVTIALTATELEACGISRDDPPPTYKAWPTSKGGMMIRFYT